MVDSSTGRCPPRAPRRGLGRPITAIGSRGNDAGSNVGLAVLRCGALDAGEWLTQGGVKQLLRTVAALGAAPYVDGGTSYLGGDIWLHIVDDIFREICTKTVLFRLSALGQQKQT